MNNANVRIKAIYNNYEAFINALKVLSSKKELDMDVISPMPLHDVEKLIPQKPSGVRWFTFFGGILGLIIGFAFPIYTVLDWQLITGGKPVVTIQAFIIIAFELLILFGAAFTLLGLLFHARLPRQNLSNYDVRFSGNSFGFVFSVPEEKINEMKNILQDADDIITDKLSTESGRIGNESR